MANDKQVAVENEMNGSKQKNGKKNKLIDLNNHLFAQLERLSDEDTKGEHLVEEIERSRAVATIARNIIDNARLALDAEKARGETVGNLPVMIGSEPEGD